MLKVALLGCGMIGKTLASAIAKGRAGEAELVGLCDLIEENVQRIAKNLGLEGILITSNPNKLIENSDADLIIEAASQKAVNNFAIKIIKSGKNLMIMSVGALVDQKLYEELKKTAEIFGKKIYLPSGAICGLDGIKGASIEKISEISLTTRKNPVSLVGAPYIITNKIKLEEIKEPVLLYEGSAKEAAKAFPKNINVATSLSIAGIGPEKTKIRIIADPTINKNIHEIYAKGDFGELTTIVKNEVFPENPKTSYLAALSAIRTLKKLTETVQVGT